MPEEPLSAEEVAHRRFSYAFRGFDPREVRDYLDRVADELRGGEKRERELQRQVADAEHRAANPVVDETVLTRSLGEETSRVLSSAHQVASELKAKAEDNAARILREAHAEAQRIRASAETVLAERTEETEAAAEEIRRAARDETEASLRQARQEAASLLADAQAKAARMVEDAEAASGRVVSELGRRRRVAMAQIEQLRAGRERLLDAYRVVRRTLEEVVDELHRAEPEARLAAEAAARRAGIEPARPGDAEADLIEVEERAAGASVTAPTARSLAGAATTADSEPRVEADGDSQPPAAVTPPGEVEAPADEETGGGAAVEERVEVPTSPVPPVAGNEVEDVDDIEKEVEVEDVGKDVKVEDVEKDLGDEVEVTPLPPPQDVEPQVRPASEVTEEPAPVEDTAVPPMAEPEEEKEPAGPEGGEPGEVGTPAAVSALFARIKADRAAAVSRAQDVLAGSTGGTVDASPEQHTAPSVPHHTGEPGEGQSSADDEALLQRRDEAIEDIVATLARRLKRVVQDEQNEVLDRLRLHRGRPPSDLLPTSADQVARYRMAGADLLQQAASAGAEFIAPGSTVSPDIGDLADGLADSLVGPLRRRLQQGVRAEDGGDAPGLAETIGAAYREWKAQRIDRLAGDAAISAFSLGTSAAAPGVRLRWVVDDDDGPCPDCDDNALAGPTLVGEAYPTGQRHPPAHAGCRCLLVPDTT